MKRIYYLYDEGNQPIVTVGIFKDENNIEFARTIAVYGDGESNPVNKGLARKAVNERFDRAEEILRRKDYINEIFPRRVNSIYDRIGFVERNQDRDIDELLDTLTLLKIDLKAKPTGFEKHLLKIDINPAN
jgi:hypothetical protein